MNRSKTNLSWLWFAMGLGNDLQIVASLSISECIVLVTGPVVLVNAYNDMRRDGVSTFLLVGFLMLLGCIVACIVNACPLILIVRGVAMTSLLFLSIPTFYWMIRKSAGGYKWMFVGLMLSSILSTFIFQRSVEVAINAGGQRGLESAEAIMGGAIYWINRLTRILNCPASGWYLSVPGWYCVGAPLAMAAFSMLTSASGRAAALGAIGSAAICLIGGKKIKKMKRLSCHFWAFVILAIIGIVCANIGYRIAATNGWLGEKSLKKYQLQTSRGTDVMSLLMSGRADSFVGLLACRDRPIIGYGPWAMDDKGYFLEFVSKYGSAEDYEFYYKVASSRMGLSMIPCHSHITECWLWFGIFGLLFWLYVVFVFIRYLRQDCFAVPQWFFWLAAGIPSYLWHICFSPLASRTNIIAIVMGCLMARAVRKGTFILPVSMQREIFENESRG